MRVCSICSRCYGDRSDICDQHGSSLSASGTGSPEMIEGYVLERQVASGIKGDRYEAVRTACGRPCLIVIHPAGHSKKGQFLEQAATARTLFHPSLADVFDSGSLETGEFFVVFESPQDPTLAQWLRSHGSPKLLDSISLVRQAAEAVAVLHGAGVYHRGLSPDNIIVGRGPDNETVVRLQNIDLGGVVEHSIVSDRFLIDTAVDSLRYFAPEQCLGQGSGAGADIYALGIILFELLAGAPPFNAPTAAGLIDQHRNHRAPEVRIDNFELRMLIAHTLMESLHKRADKRQPTVNALARQLRHIEQLATHVSTPPPAGTVRIPPRDLESTDVESSRVVPPPPVAITPPAVLVNESLPDETPKPVAKPIRVESTLVDDYLPAPGKVADLAPAPLSAAERPRPEPDNAVKMKEARKNVEELGRTFFSYVRKKSAPAISHFSRLKDRRNEPATETEPTVVEGQQKANPKAFKKGRLVSREDAALEMARELAAVSRTRAKKPRKIEWITPDDDIPSLADAVTPAPMEEATRTREVIEVKPEPIVFEGPVPRPPARKITSDVPRPQQERSESQKADAKPEAQAKIIEQRPEKSDAAAPEVKPPAVPAERPGHNESQRKPRPSVPATGVRASAPPKVPSANTIIDLKPRGIRISGLKSSGMGPAVAVDEAEEITLVPANRSRLIVPVDQPQPARRQAPARRVVPIPADPVDFFPTLLGGTVKPAAIESAPGGSILSTFYADQQPPALPYRSIAAGTGLVLIVATLLFFNNSIWNSISSAGSDDSAAATVRAKTAESLPAASGPISRPAEVPAEKPKPATVTAEPPKTRPAAAAPATVSAPSPARSTAPPKAAAAKTTAEAAKRREPVREPIITTARPEKPTRAIPTKTEPITVRSNGATRPRIVKEQR